jgi:hypothetical protein
MKVSDSAINWSVSAKAWDTYYSLVPAMADIIENLSGQDFDDIVPEVYDESE